MITMHVRRCMCVKWLHTSLPSTMRVCSGALRSARSSHKMCACVDATNRIKPQQGCWCEKSGAIEIRRCRYSSIGQRFLEHGYRFLILLSSCCPVRIQAYSSFADTRHCSSISPIADGRTAEASTVAVAVAAEHRYHCGRKSTARIIPLDSRRV